MRAITLHVISSCIRRLVAECAKIHESKMTQFEKGKLKKFPQHSLRHLQEAKDLQSYFKSKFVYKISSDISREGKIIES